MRRPTTTTLEGLFIDAVGFAGIALIGRGVWMYDPAASLIVVGALLLVAAAWFARG